MKVRFLIFLLVACFLLFCATDHRIHWDWIYTHWLYDYHFGFMKRGLVGEIVMQVLGHPAIVPLSVVRAVAWIIFGINSSLFLYFFKSLLDRTSATEERKSLFVWFVFVLLAPTSLRNFAYDLGRFDQIGSLLLLAQWFFIPVWLTSLCSIVLVLIHENYIFIFFPAILLLTYLQKGLKAALLVGIPTLITTLLVVRFGKPSVDMDTLWNYLTAKADAPLDHNVRLLYWGAKEQLLVNWDIFKTHLPYLPGYVLYALYCLPVYLIFSRVPLAGLARVGTLGIFIGYFSILLLSDWCRSISNLFIVLSFLVLYFLKDENFRKRILTSSLLRSKWLYAAIALSFVLPSAGVDLPRIYKLIEIVNARLQGMHP